MTLDLLQTVLKYASNIKFFIPEILLISLEQVIENTIINGD